MKIFAVIAEFNPFHNGHQALLEYSAVCGGTHTVAIMSGNFVQRGEPAITEKRVRAHAALVAGADLVLELPLPYATATAQCFAQGAVESLFHSGVVDGLVFGSESGTLAELQAAAHLVDDPSLGDFMAPWLAKGSSFAAARTLALKSMGEFRTAEVLAHPNNILGVEYLRAAEGLGWCPEFHTLRRLGVGHDSRTPQAGYASASLLREYSIKALSPYVPPAALNIYQCAHADGLYPADVHRLDASILADLRRMSLSQLAALPHVSEGLEHRLYNAIHGDYQSLEALCRQVETKRYPFARIRRLITAAYLGITHADAVAPPPYLRILGFNGKGRELLSEMQIHATLPFHTSLKALMEQGPMARRFGTLECDATALYTLLLPTIYPSGYELTAPGIYLEDTGSPAPNVSLL